MAEDAVDQDQRIEAERDRAASRAEMLQSAMARRATAMSQRYEDLSRQVKLGYWPLCLTVVLIAVAAVAWDVRELWAFAVMSLLPMSIAVSLAHLVGQRDSLGFTLRYEVQRAFDEAYIPVKWIMAWRRRERGAVACFDEVDLSDVTVSPKWAPRTQFEQWAREDAA